MQLVLQKCDGWRLRLRPTLQETVCSGFNTCIGTQMMACENMLAYVQYNYSRRLGTAAVLIPVHCYTDRQPTNMSATAGSLTATTRHSVQLRMTP